MNKHLFVGAALLATLTAAPSALADADPPLLRALSAELSRALEMQATGAAKPYWISYEVDDVEEGSVVSSFGTTVRRAGSHKRELAPTIRVGDFSLDGAARTGGFRMGRFGAGPLFPLTDDEAAIRRAAWLASDDAYKTALEMLDAKRASRANTTTSPDYIADFTKAQPVTSIDDRSGARFDLDKLEALAKKLSAVGKEFSFLQGAVVGVRAMSARRYFVSSEGARVVEPYGSVMIEVHFNAQADDGMKVSNAAFFSAVDTASLPAEADLVAETRRTADALGAIRKAPVASDYTGPVLFEGIAAPQLVRWMLAGSVTSGEEVAYGGDAMSELHGKIGERVLPAGFTVYDDPTIDKLGDLPLLGRYKTDDEGVTAEKVTVIQDGKFKGYLMSRVPRKGFDHSNGHGRASGTMISNLVVTAPGGEANLRGRLIAAARAAGKSYGVVIRAQDDSDMPEIQRALSLSWGMGRGLVAYKVTADGKEEPLRGVSLGDLRLRALKDLVAAGSKPYVQSTGRPGSSVVAPALLLKEVELKRDTMPQPKPPVVPRP